MKLNPFHKKRKQRQPSLIQIQSLGEDEELNDKIQLLHFHAESGNLEGIKKLIKNNPFILDHPDRKGQTALHVACGNDQFEIVKFLEKQGVDFSVKDNHGWSCLHFAAAGGHYETLDHLLDKNIEGK